MQEMLKVYCSGAFIEAFRRMLPLLERAAGAEISVKQGTSVGIGKNSIPKLLRDGEPCDVAIFFDDVADELVQEGIIQSDSKRIIASSSIGMAVREGAPRPDISNVKALRSALMNASSIAYSASGSGIYLSTELFPSLGIFEAIRAKCRLVQGERVGSVVGRGEVEIGFQQMSELVAMPGIAIVGPLPAQVQRVTLISAGVPARGADEVRAKALIAGLMSNAAREFLGAAGLDAPGADAAHFA